MTQSEIKLAKSLSLQKYRKEHNAYIVEGHKLVQEWMKFRADIKWIICSEEYYQDHKTSFTGYEEALRIAAVHIIDRISNLKTTPGVLAVVHMPPAQPPVPDRTQKWHLVLDRIADPGNLGTIIRLADWLGMSEIIVSPGTVDVYNPKVIQSTMGSFLRVHVIEMPLEHLVSNSQKPLIGTVLHGESLLDFEKKKIDEGFLLLGSESHGLPADIIAGMDHNITLPSRNSQAESLNVAVAAAMICSRLMY